ncbi:Nramp family divalent metal transporter [Geodermatophilus sp. Leaf369]|uniref:Nramp family divalent metal transporter n=1 Tax=Geodermatophilus sp. Leaf369 TaxID=1736354 RepID=UPI001F36A1B7|nr:Nramp family divalent metal transporter [Geodermatophilus sp. Leaf369]
MARSGADADPTPTTGASPGTDPGGDPLAAQEPGRTFPTGGGALPMPGTADLPEPRPLRKVLGPGVIGAGIGLASGEFVLYPYIASEVGLSFLWAAFVGVTLQLFINMEIERYTLATGETALTGFSRLWRHWGLVFALLTILANLWPGWATSSATVLTYAVGGGNVTLIALLMLASIGLVLTLSPVVYTAVERIEFVKVGAVLAFIVIAFIAVVGADDVAETRRVVTDFGSVPSQLGLALVLGALAFAGGGGGQNLVQSNWIRDKGFGMGARIPRLVSPVTGEDQAKPSTGFLFPATPDNLRRWKGWWRVANTEQMVSFWFLTWLTISATSVIAYATVFGRDTPGNDISFLQTEGQVLADTVGGWFGTFFWWIGAVSLYAAALGICDYTARLVADTVKVNYLARSERWSESRVYSLVVWGLLVVGAVVLLSGFDQPLVLLVISSVVGGFMMFVYSILLIRLNRTALPKAIQVRGYRLAVMVLAVLVFGGISAVIIGNQVLNPGG